jgi:hypothetical protein
MSKSESEVTQKYTGHFRVDNKGILHVSYGGYSKSTQLGGHAKYPKLLAEILLRELVGQAHRDR